MNDKVKLKLIITIIEIIVTHGIPAFMEFIRNLGEVDAISLEEIEALYGDMDSKDYFPDLPDDKP